MGASWLQHMVLKQQADKSFLAVLDSSKKSIIVINVKAPLVLRFSESII